MPLVNALRRGRPDLRLLVTTITPTGSERVRALWGDCGRARLPALRPARRGRPFPRSLPSVRGADHGNRDVAEPAVRLPRRGIPGYILNARLSERSLRGYRVLAPLVGRALRTVRTVAAQSQADASASSSWARAPAQTLVDRQPQVRRRRARAVCRRSPRECRAHWGGSGRSGSRRARTRTRKRPCIAIHRRLRARFPDCCCCGRRAIPSASAPSPNTPARAGWQRVDAVARALAAGRRTRCS